jgi:hypothetical protein
MSNHRTQKGTLLPLRDIRGNDYLDVKYRVIWFREERPDWSIETEMMSVTASSAYAKATIRDEKGRILSTSHKFENAQGFPDFIEKAETGAIGRALALIGFGTQFCADELDEGERIVDSPVAPKTKPALVKPPPPKDIPEVFKDEDLSDYVFKGGKFRNQTMSKVGEFELNGYVAWSKKQKDLHASTLKEVKKIEAYLDTREFERMKK